jgi:exosortase/archaeosortase family protein
MKKKDLIYALILVVFALFIWLRDLAWMTTTDDTLPILVALPVFYWLGSPWKWREVDQPFSGKIFLFGAFFFLLGIALNITFFLAVSWVLLLKEWLDVRVLSSVEDRMNKLLVLPLMAFPWVSLDLTRLGWWFRLSGAKVASYFFVTLGLDVVQEGTNLIVAGLPISVEAACAGMNTLQSMLIAGTVVNFVILGNTVRYWFNIPVLVIVTWIANTLRILMISLAALLAGPQFAMGNFHIWGGWFILICMFILCWLIFSLQEPKEDL